MSKQTYDPKQPVSPIEHEQEKRASIPTTERQGEENAIVDGEPQQFEYDVFRHDKGNSDLQTISMLLQRFNQERDWEQFHDAKNLALSISIEAAELNECFLWKNADEADREKVEEELADVFLCAIMLADKYDMDIKEICLKKIEKNAQKYPVEKAKGKATKYNEL